MNTETGRIKESVDGKPEQSVRASFSNRATGDRPATIGMQIGEVSFLDEGTEKVLDNLQQLGRVNCLVLGAFTYSTGLGGRQSLPYPLPDHGKQEYDRNFHGGSFAEIHPQYYKDIGLNPLVLKAPEHGSWDFLALVPAAARKRGIKNLAWITDKWRRDIPGIEKLAEVDLNGRVVSGASLTCQNNPYYRNLMLGLVEDYLRTYGEALDGILYAQERAGPMIASMGGRGEGHASCFCQFCRAQAKDRGISVERAMAGYRNLDKLARSARNGSRPPDGYYVAFWRVLLQWPEILSWENLYEESIKETYRVLRERVKAIKPDASFGLHIHHLQSFHIVHRAVLGPSELAQYADFLKLVMYANAAGPRFAETVVQDCKGIYRDLPPDEMAEFLYRVMNYQEGPYQQAAKTGFVHDYVYRETTRALAGVQGTRTMIFSGLDIDLPTEADQAKCTPESVKSEVKQAFQAGAHGVILSGKYAQMKLANLAGVGAAVREMDIT